MKVLKKKVDKLRFPERLVSPIKRFLESELIRLKRQKETIKNSDPFTDESRATENSLEEDVDEQLGHFEAEVKTNFVAKQIVQLRKALAMIKIGKYGICDRCGKMIDTDRLVVEPGATRCVKCAREGEK